MAPPRPADPAATADGRATLTSLTDDADPVADLDDPGTALAYPLPRSDEPIPFVARGEGSLAPALGAGLVTQVTGGRGRGLLATACTPPSGESWFVGGGGSVGRRTTVLLTNPDSTPALVDVEVFGPSGPVVARGGEGVLVPPQSQKTLRLDVLVPGTSRTALHVVARAGRISAAVEDIDTLGLIPRGSDYVPQTMAPSTRVVVPGLLGGTTGTRLLQVAAPGDADAIVNVHLVATDGTFAPDSAALLEIPAGSVAQVDLAPFLDGVAATGVLLESDVPVVAGVRTVLPASNDGAEVTYTAGVPALTGAAAFGPLVVDDTHEAVLLLTATEADGLVTVTEIGDAGPVDREVVVPGGTTLVVPLLGSVEGAGLVVATVDGSGPVEAAVLLSSAQAGGRLRASVPLRPGVTTVTVPAVRPDPATGVPGH